jgi:hypothetical protein
MKQFIIKNADYFGLLFVFLITSIICVTSITAQDSFPNPVDIIDDVKKVTSWTDLLGIEAVIYTFLITVGGYLSRFIPVLNKIDSGTYRVFVFAILVIAGSLVIGIGNVWIGAISYFFSTSLYEVVLKWIAPSPKPAKE